MGHVLVFYLAGIDLVLYLAQIHGESFGAVDVCVRGGQAEGGRDGFGEVIVDSALPVGKDLVGSRHCDGRVRINRCKAVDDYDRQQ